MLAKIQQRVNLPLQIPVYQRADGAVGVYTFIPGKSLDQVKGRNDRILGQKLGSSCICGILKRHHPLFMVTRSDMLKSDGSGCGNERMAVRKTMCGPY